MSGNLVRFNNVTGGGNSLVTSIVYSVHEPNHTIQTIDHSNLRLDFADCIRLNYLVFIAVDFMAELVEQKRHVNDSNVSAN